MIQEFTKADGQLCRVQERPDGLFNVEAEEGLTTWGITAEEVERQIEMEKHKLFAAQYVPVSEQPKQKTKRVSFIPGTKIAQLDPVAKKALIDWVEQHYTCCTLECAVKNYARLAATLKEINGDDFTPGMEGFREREEYIWGISSRIDLDADLPANFVDEIYAMQSRQGSRCADEIAVNLHVIYCVELTWELLRRGHKLGPH